MTPDTRFLMKLTTEVAAQSLTESLRVSEISLRDQNNKYSNHNNIPHDKDLC